MNTAEMSFDTRLELLHKRYNKLAADVFEDQSLMTAEQKAQELDSILRMYMIEKRELFLELRVREIEIARKENYADKMEAVLVPDDKWRRHRIRFWKWKPNAAAEQVNTEVGLAAERYFAERRAEIAKEIVFFAGEPEEEEQTIAEGEAASMADLLERDDELVTPEGKDPADEAPESEEGNVEPAQEAEEPEETVGQADVEQEPDEAEESDEEWCLEWSDDEEGEESD